MYIDIVTTGSIRDRLLRGELETLRVPIVATDVQSEIRERCEESDDRIGAAMNKIASEKTSLIEQLHQLLANAMSEDELDVQVARERIAELKRDPGELVEGDELEASLLQIMQ